jgi:anaphase-promoting complex subunit 6
MVGSLMRCAERLLRLEQRPHDAVHITQLLWQMQPQSSRTAMLHVNCLMELRQYDAALHVLNCAVDCLEPLSVHLARMQCSFELGDHKACVASAEAVLAATQDAVCESLTNGASSSSSDLQMQGSNEELLGGGGTSTTRATPLSMAVQALCYLGRCAELVADPERAVGYYRQALTLDPMCTSAMHALLDHRLLNPKETIRLIETLVLPVDAEPLRQYYVDCAAVLIHPSSVAPITHAPGDIDERGLPSGSPSVPSAPKRQDGPDDGSSSTRLVQTVAHLSHLAAKEHAHNRLHVALQLSQEACRRSPYDKDALCVHLRILVDKKAAPELFEIAHALTNRRGRAALAVYAIGCYYYAQASYERAGRYFSRATELDPSFVEAWVAFGHCYAKLEEGEQALAVYRRALYLFPGLYACATYVGMQYSRIHSWKLALCFLEDAQRICPPTDPLVLNEIAVLCVRNHQLNHALGFLQKALDHIDVNTCSEYLDCILFNVGMVHRKLKRFDIAIQFFTSYVKCRPRGAHGYTALGFTYHLSGDLKSAIAHYHTAMSIKPDVFCRDMLDRALALEFGSGVGGLGWAGGHGDHPGAVPPPGHRRGEYVDPSPTTFGAGSSMGGATVDVNNAGQDVLAGPQRNRRRSDSSQTDMFGGPSPHGSVGRSLNF